MSSLGIFDKETKTYKKVAGTAEAAAIDGSMSDTSTNPVQNKVVKDALDHKLKGYTITYTVPANTGGWHKIAQTTNDYFNFDLYTNGRWTSQPESNAHFQIQNTNGNVRIVQLSGLKLSRMDNGISKIRMVRVTDNKDIWILEEYSPSSNYSEIFRFTIAGDVTVTPLDGSVDTTTDFKDSVSLDVSDITTGTVITTGNIDSHLTDLKYGEVAGGKNLANVDNISNVFKFKVSENRTYIVSANGANTYRVLGYKNGKHTMNIALNTNLINYTIINTSDLDIDEIYIDFTNKVIGFLDDKLFLRYYEDKDVQYEPYIPSVKMLAKGKADKSETTVNLLKPTLETTTKNGVTCTNNGDGTYTLNGTASDITTFVLITNENTIPTFSGKLVGCPSGGGSSSYLLRMQNSKYNEIRDTGNGIEISDYEYYQINIRIASGYTCNNLIFKPMLTTNLNATYDDFVPYTGDTGRLNGDVAELNKTVSNHTHTKSQITDFPSSLPANGGNSATVNGHTVNSNVPANAVFTDTKVTNTLNTNTKAYVTGTTSSSTNTGTQIFDTGVYLGTGTGQLTLEGSNNVNYGTGASILNVKIPPSHDNTLYGVNIVPYRNDMTDYVTGLNIDCGNSTGPGMLGINVTCRVNTYEPTVYINRSGGTNSYALKVPNGKSYIATIYSNSSTITTSDREKKTDIQSISDKYEELFFKLQPRLFKFKDGTSGRIHIGAIAQEVEEALKDVGLSDTEFAGFVRQEKEYVVNKETGEITQEEGYDYYLRYEEFVMLLCHMLQKLYAEKEEQDNKISDLESRIVALESKLG